jgi:transcriptional regulator with XRE-family HTH domain
MAESDFSQQELAARVRAARGYSGLHAKQLAKELSISVETMSRIENGRRAVPYEERTKIAQACGVPRWFLENGWAATPGLRNPDFEIRHVDGSVTRVELHNEGATPDAVARLERSLADAILQMGFNVEMSAIAHAEEDPVRVPAGTSFEKWVIHHVRRLEEELLELRREGVGRDLEDAEQRRQGAETAARAVVDQGEDRGGGAE